MFFIVFYRMNIYNDINRIYLFSYGNIAEALKIFRSLKSSGKQDRKQSNY